MDLEIKIKSDKITLIDKPIKSQYCPKNGIYLGNVLLCDYGYDYSGIADKEKPYIIKSEFITFKENFKRYQKESDARIKAIEAGKYIIENIFKL